MVRCIHLPTIALALIVTAVAHASPAPLTFAEALGSTAFLPTSNAERAAAATTRAIHLPRAWTPLLVLATPRLRVGDGPRAEGTFAIQQAIPLADLDDARATHLAARAELHGARAAALALETRLATASAWIDGWAARERLAASDREVALAHEMLAITERGTQAGAFTAPELADARAFAAEATLRRLDAEGAVAEAGFALARALVRPDAVAIAGELPTAPLPDAAGWSVALARARHLPAIAARTLTARAARARAVEERASRGAQIIVGAELVRDAPGSLVGGLTIGFTLPHDRGTREAREAEVEASVADAEADELAARAATELAAARHEVEHTAEVVVALERDLVPAADDAVARRRRAFALGETTIVELLAAQRIAVMAHARLADARAMRAWAQLHAWLLIEGTR